VNLKLQNCEGLLSLSLSLSFDTYSVVDRLFDAWSKQSQWLALTEITNFKNITIIY
jgi:hypothetical protein